MKRRQFLTLVGGAAAWPVAAHAQQPAIPVVGFVSVNSATEWTPFATAFRDGLKEVGYVEGQNAAVEYRWAEGQNERVPTYVTEMIRRRAAVIVGSFDVALAAKATATTIPMVFVTGSDPVKSGLVASLNQPGGNITGVYFFSNDLVAKRLGLLHELSPRATVVALLVNPNVAANDQLQDALDAARVLGLQVNVLSAGSEREIDAAFATVRPAAALVVAADPFFTERRAQIIALAARHALPAVYSVREWTAGGGLMSYSTNLREAYRQGGAYAGRILKGEKPADLPVIQPTKFELVINLKTARALGIAVPSAMLASADEVIE
jgi:putative tryptophan/tyrosine transport system substrate-binding protein